MADVDRSRSAAGRLSKKSKSTAKGLGGEGDVHSVTSSAMMSHNSISVCGNMSHTCNSYTALVTRMYPIGGGLQLQGIVFFLCIFRQFDQAFVVGTYLHRHMITWQLELSI